MKGNKNNLFSRGRRQLGRGRGEDGKKWRRREFYADLRRAEGKKREHLREKRSISAVFA